MKKQHLVLTAVAMTTAIGGTAFAAPPVTIPPAGDITITIQATETPCGAFTLALHDQSTTRIFSRPDGTQVVHVAGPISAVLTSERSGRSIALDISGPVKLSADAMILTGSSLIWNPSLMELVKGRVVVPTGEPTDWRITGSRTALCAVLGA